MEKGCGVTLLEGVFYFEVSFILQDILRIEGRSLDCSFYSGGGSLVKGADYKSFQVVSASLSLYSTVQLLALKKTLLSIC